ncbi:MAG: hypothetical protein JSU63_10285, partial [Phycisphaerales bacterium]
MTQTALLAIIGVILAVYALARPPQRKSVRLFVPFWTVTAGLVNSCILLIALDYLVEWEIKAPGWKFVLGNLAFFLPIAVTV